MQNRLFSTYEMREDTYNKQNNQLISTETSEKLQNIGTGLNLLADALTYLFQNKNSSTIIDFLEQTLRHHAANRKVPHTITSSPAIFSHYHLRLPELAFALQCFITLSQQEQYSVLGCTCHIAEKILSACDDSVSEFAKKEEMTHLFQQLLYARKNESRKAGI